MIPWCICQFLGSTEPLLKDYILCSNWNSEYVVHGEGIELPNLAFVQKTFRFLLAKRSFQISHVKIVISCVLFPTIWLCDFAIILICIIYRIWTVKITCQWVHSDLHLRNLVEFARNSFSRKTRFSEMIRWFDVTNAKKWQLAASRKQKTFCGLGMHDNRNFVTLFSVTTCYVSWLYTFWYNLTILLN